MKKLTIISLLLLAVLLAGCNYPASEGETPKEPDDSMATEIAQILTGTPVKDEPTPTMTETAEQTAEETEAPPTSTPEPTEETEAPPTSTSEPTEETPEPTPTNTPTAAPTATLSDTDPVATLGDSDWVDNMANGDNWPTGVNEYSTIAFADGYLKLTAETELDGWRLSWPFLTDFYLEASMQTPDCEGSDHYGLMFRVPANADANKGYLFGITCDGRYSLRRWDGTTMYFPINWTDSDAIVKGENAVNKLGIMASEAELTFYINGEKVDTVTDNAYLAGSFGIFVGSVNTDNFTVWVDQVRYWENP